MVSRHETKGRRIIKKKTDTPDYIKILNFYRVKKQKAITIHPKIQRKNKKVDMYKGLLQIISI